jgi:hypothetical protein
MVDGQCRGRTSRQEARIESTVVAHADGPSSQVHNLHHVRMAGIDAGTVVMIASMRGRHGACGHLRDSAHRLLLHRGPRLLSRRQSYPAVRRRRTYSSIATPGRCHVIAFRALWVKGYSLVAPTAHRTHHMRTPGARQRVRRLVHVDTKRQARVSPADRVAAKWAPYLGGATSAHRCGFRRSTHHVSQCLCW